MNPLRLLICTTILFTSGRTFAYQPDEGNINLTVGPYLYRTPYNSPDPVVSSENRGGYGLIATGDSNTKGSIELGMFYLDKLYLRDEGPDILAQKLTQIHITMGYRHWWSSWFSTSLALFSAYPMGDPVDIYRRITPGTFLDTSAMDLTEYGFDLAAQIQLFGTQKFGVVFEPRYSWNVTPKQHEAADHFGFLLGLRFMVQEKGQAAAARQRRQHLRESGQPTAPPPPPATPPAN